GVPRALLLGRDAVPGPALPGPRRPRAGPGCSCPAQGAAGEGARGGEDGQRARQDCARGGDVVGGGLEGRRPGRRAGAGPRGGGWLPEDEVVRIWSTAVSTLAVDTALEIAVGGAEAQLVHRVGGESEGGIETEHEAGKLYLLGLEERPLLKTRRRAPHMGHLF